MPCSFSHRRLLSLSVLSLSSPNAFCLCNAGIAGSRSIWVSFIHVHLVHAHTWDCNESPPNRRRPRFCSPSRFLTNGFLNERLAGGFDTAHAAARYSLCTLSLFARSLLALAPFTSLTPMVQFSANRSRARRQILIFVAHRPQGVRSGGDQVPRRGGRHQFQLGGLRRRHEAGDRYTTGRRSKQIIYLCKAARFLV